MLFYFLFVSCILLVQQTNAIIDADVLQALETKSSVDILIRMKKQPISTISTGFQPYTSRNNRMKAYKRDMELVSDFTQANLMKIVNDKQARRLHNVNEDDFSVQSFKLTNMVTINGATKELVQTLDELDEVYEVQLAKIYHLIQSVPSSGSVVTSNSTGELEWGLTKIQAEKVWEKFNQGENVLVGGIDTGVLGTHEALKDNYNGGNYSWLDPYNDFSEPNDSFGHGTHTMGTIVGQNGIGVAPKAKWMACRSCSTNTCTTAALLACGEFMACPDPECNEIPDIVCNSWGGGQGDTFFDEIIETWHKAEIIPVFAIGNAGGAPYGAPGSNTCGSANSPGDSPRVIAVGATDDSDELTSFSSIGPSARNDSSKPKPDISAPGQDIKSAWIGGNDAYKMDLGTSMACPHVVGVITLMLSKNKDLTYDQVYDIITGTAKKDLPKYTECGNLDWDTPNNWFGHGRIDALAAIESV